MEEQFDVIVLGGGIAGCGVAAFLAEKVRVMVLEREVHAGMHSTGRSAALFSETYGSEPIRALSRASNAFLTTPPAEFDLLSPLGPRGALYLATPEQEEKLRRVAQTPSMRAAATLIGGDEALVRCPMLKPGLFSAALWEPGAQDIDVDALLQAFIRRLRALGGTLMTGTEAEALVRMPDGWRVSAGGKDYRAPLIVNAAGAWADVVASLADLSPLGIQPMQRTAVMVAPPEGAEIADWPCVIDIDETFYFKPDAGQLLLSPADENPVEPGDAQPEELDVAIAAHRVEQATTLEVRRVSHKWAGLRSFAPDRLPVVGADPRTTGFFWLAGQGGYGIQTAPALSRAAAALILGDPVPEDIQACGVDMALLAPDRLI